MKQHTKTPWVREKYADGEAIVSEIEMAYGSTRKAIDLSGGSIDETHMLHCVNLHDELVEKLKGTTVFMQSLVGKYPVHEPIYAMTLNAALNVLAKCAAHPDNAKEEEEDNDGLDDGRGEAFRND